MFGPNNIPLSASYLKRDYITITSSSANHLLASAANFNYSCIVQTTVYSMKSFISDVDISFK